MREHVFPTSAGGVVPVLGTRNIVRALHEYQDIGFTARITDNRRYGFVRLGNARMHIAQFPISGAPVPASTCLIFVDNPDRLAESIARAGHGELEMPIDQPWGLREGRYIDTDGNVLRFGRTLPGVFI